MTLDTCPSAISVTSTSAGMGVQRPELLHPPQQAAVQRVPRHNTEPEGWMPLLGIGTLQCSLAEL